jgi:hypothetical protein
MSGMAKRVLVNRAPVLTLWAAVVAERLGQPWETALTLGKAVAGLNAQSKGRRLGIYRPVVDEGAARGKKRAPTPRKGVIELLGRQVPVEKTAAGVRAVVKDKVESPDAVQRYLAGKFGKDFETVREAMRALAKAFKPADLASRAYELYEAFRPEIPAGKRGWGAKGALDLGRLSDLAQ